METITSLTDSELSALTIAIVLLLSFAHIFGYAFSRLQMPKVVGEIFGGILLGPSFLGYFFPEVYESVFWSFEGEGKVLSLIYWLGLICLMFVSGYKVKTELKKEDKKIVIGLLIGSTILPFIAGWFMTEQFGFIKFLGDKQNLTALKIVTAIAISVTSIPVISKIFFDLDIINTRFARIMLATATIHDIILWVALTIATGMVSKEGVSAGHIISNVAITLAFLVLSLFAAPAILRLLSRSKAAFLKKSPAEGLAVILCLVFVAVSCYLNINIIYGALMAGITVGILKGNRIERARERIADVSMSTVVPIYFAIVGLKINIIAALDIKLLVLFVVLATGLQLAGTLSAVRFMNMNWISSFNFAFTMNARGGPCIVLASVTYDLGIISQTFFVTLIIAAMVTSLTAGYWLRFVIKKGYELVEFSDKNGMSIKVLE